MIERLVGAFRASGWNRPAEASSSETAEGDEGDEGDAGADDPPTEELFLDSDERILLVLSEHDGRMLQQDVVEATDYSPARVSELLDEMESDGRVNRYWKDGNKVVAFPELGPE